MPKGLDRGEKETAGGVKIRVPISERGLLQGPSDQQSPPPGPPWLHCGVGVGHAGYPSIPGGQEPEGARDVQWDSTVVLPEDQLGIRLIARCPSWVTHLTIIETP